MKKPHAITRRVACTFPPRRLHACEYPKPTRALPPGEALRTVSLMAAMFGGLSVDTRGLR